MKILDAGLSHGCGRREEREWKFSEKSSHAIQNRLLCIKALSPLNIKGALSEAVLAHSYTILQMILNPGASN